MRSAPLQLAELRQLIAGRFPVPSVRKENIFPTEVTSIDRMLGGGIPTGSLTEIVSHSSSNGGQLMLLQLLRAARERQQRVALIDVMDAFDPYSHESELLEHLIWVRCREGKETAQVADILVRDNNFSLVILDVRGMSLKELRRIPSTAWYRMQRAVEPTTVAIVVQSNFPLVPSAQLRLQFGGSFGLSALETSQQELIECMELEVQRNRKISERAG